MKLVRMYVTVAFKPQEIFLVLISSRSQDHSAAGRIMSMKNSLTPPGIELTTFRLVAQCLNQLRHRVTQLVILRP